MSHMESRQRSRIGGDCPAGLEEDLAEVEAIMLGMRAEYDEKLAHVLEYVRHLEGLVGSLGSAVAANQLRLNQIEGCFASLASFSKLFATEAERLSSE